MGMAPAGAELWSTPFTTSMQPSDGRAARMISFFIGPLSSERLADLEEDPPANHRDVVAAEGRLGATLVEQVGGRQQDPGLGGVCQQVEARRGDGEVDRGEAGEGVAPVHVVEDVAGGGAPLA